MVQRGRRAFMYDSVTADCCSPSSGFLVFTMDASGEYTIRAIPVSIQPSFLDGSRIQRVARKRSPNDAILLDTCLCLHRDDFSVLRAHGDIHNPIGCKIADHRTRINPSPDFQLIQLVARLTVYDNQVALPISDNHIHRPVTVEITERRLALPRPRKAIVP